MAEIDERYKRGMIYTIRNYTDDTLIYVGSTINTLSKRFNKHKEGCKYSKSHIKLHSLIENNDWSDWYIELYEHYPCNNKKELNRREGQVIREIGTINKNIAGRTNKEWHEDNADKLKEKRKEYYEQNADKIKEYREQNADKIKEQRKEYYEQNADKLKEKAKEWREQNPDKFKEQIKEYREQNADKIKERRKEYRKQNNDKIKEYMKEWREEKVCCNICGAFSTKSHLSRHQKTKKCMAKIPNN